MAILSFRQAVLMTFRVVMATGAHAIGCGAIAVLMNMEGALLVCRESFEIRNYLYRIALLRKAHHATTLLACRGVQDGDGFLSRRRVLRN